LNGTTSPYGIFSFAPHTLWYGLQFFCSYIPFNLRDDLLSLQSY
jgi:hypothetical protein